MIELFTKIYETFAEKAQTFTTLGLKPIEFIDRYRGQPLNPEQFEYYPLPAVFIDWKIKWEKAGQVYNGNVELDFHLVVDPTWDTSNVSTNYLEGLKFILYETAVRSVLDNLSCEVTSKLKRIDENPVDTGVVNYHVMRYECTYFDPGIIGTQYIEAIIEKLKLAGYLVDNV
jgi:hypothetical protein